MLNEERPSFVFKKYWPLCAEMRTTPVILIPAQYPTIILII